MSDNFRTELRRRRREANLSLHQLAELVPCDQGYLSKVENGHRRPGPDMTASLDQALGANGALFALAGEDQEGGEDVRRRTVLQALSAAGMAVAGWPLPSVETPRRVGMDHVADIADSTAVYRGWVSRHGGAAVQQPAAQLLDRAAAMHAAASEPKVRTALLVAIADLAGLGAYIARDIGDHRSADEHAWLALSAATAAGNTALGATPWSGWLATTSSYAVPRRRCRCWTPPRSAPGTCSPQATAPTSRASAPGRTRRSVTPTWCVVPLATLRMRSRVSTTRARRTGQRSTSPRRSSTASPGPPTPTWPAPTTGTPRLPSNDSTRPWTYAACLWPATASSTSSAWPKHCCMPASSTRPVASRSQRRKPPATSVPGDSLYASPDWPAEFSPTPAKRHR
ncbi:helix-turn-helix transcriptional regulator [Micromonospora sp. RL09-050-HVF-A]|nr:helix-turn-helix transcriptional regulator [Micromonospora sp. RL09-050-HVF-A]